MYCDTGAQRNDLRGYLGAVPFGVPPLLMRLWTCQLSRVEAGLFFQSPNCLGCGIKQESSSGTIEGIGWSGQKTLRLARFTERFPERAGIQKYATLLSVMQTASTLSRYIMYFSKAEQPNE